jgi:small subunit ribosomal protein S3
MGQKVHPTGFRIGVNKSHDSTWYSNYSNYGQTLKEDYLIRQCLKTKWGSLYSKSGITKLQINRKVNKIELLVYATRPKTLSTSQGNQLSFSELKSEVLKFLPKSKQIRLKVVQLTQSDNESLLTARLLADQLEKRVAFRKAIRQTAQRLQKSGVKGFKIQVSGRLNGAEMARTEWVREGRVPLQTLRADISYSSYEAHTIYGVLGIKVWIFNKEII